MYMIIRHNEYDREKKLSYRKENVEYNLCQIFLFLLMLEINQPNIKKNLID